jgi:hypothetical protein
VPYTPPIPSSFTTAVLPLALPSQANAITVTAAVGVWTFGAWAQLAAANLLTKHALAYLFITSPSGGDIQLQVGTGDAGSEVARGDYRIGVVGATGFYLTIETFPLLTIPANARVALRLASSGGSDTCMVKAEFYPVPL